MDFFPVVLQAIPGENRTVYAYFNDGTVRLADMNSAIQRGGVFSLLQDDSFFRNRLTVMNGSVAWDVTGTRDETKCIDLDPIQLYQSCPVVADPLEETYA